MSISALDAYELRARRAPALICFAPLAGSLVLVSEEMRALSSTAALVALLVAASPLIAEAVRERGQVLMSEIRARGASQLELSLTASSLAPRVLAEARGFISRLQPALKLPEREDEERNPLAAARAYQEVFSCARLAVRDQSAFPLVQAELVSFGFRRNLLALRDWATGAATLGLLVGVGGCLWGSLIGGVVALAVNAGFLLLYSRVVTLAWVVDADRNYGRQVLLALASLSYVEERARDVTLLKLEKI